MLTLTAPKPFVLEQTRDGDEPTSLEQVCAFMASKIAPRDPLRSHPWTTPTLGEICIGLEINGYLPAEI